MTTTNRIWYRFISASLILCFGISLVVASLLPSRPAIAREASGLRIAVVVSNSHYAQLGTLRNPEADGKLVSSALRAAGFSVLNLSDLDDDKFRSALRQLARDSAKADVTLFYYAGHGVQIAGTNYLLPVDVPIPDQEDDIRLASVSADDVISVIKSPYKIVVLDACRDNPILGRALAKGRSASYKRGLASVSPPSEETGGIFIAYSTQTDAVALDGEGENSPFAQSFSEHVGANTSIDDMFALVTRDVLKKTNGQQRPFKYASMDTVFCLSGKCLAPESQRVASRGTTDQVPSPLADSAIQSFRELNASALAPARKKIEDQLWEQLRGALPARVIYGVRSDGTEKAYGFVPNSVKFDGRRVTVTIQEAQLKDGAFTYDETGSADISFDCDSKEWVRTRTQGNGGVKLFTRAEQKAELVIVQPGSLAASLVGALCRGPLRLTPLWSVENLTWTDIGQSISAASAIRYKDPLSDDIWFVLVRARPPEVSKFGWTLLYGWDGINCRTKEYQSNTFFGLNKSGQVVSLAGDEGKWTHFEESSVAANAYVLLCDQPK
jgi:uncharacterized caspase-like protein